MVWVDNWETFYAEAEKLYIEHPDHVRATLSPPMIARNRSHPQIVPLSSAQTRYVMKYRHVDGKLELKVTNDRVVRTRRTSGCLALSHHTYSRSRAIRSASNSSPTRRRI